MLCARFVATAFCSDTELHRTEFWTMPRPCPRALFRLGFSFDGLRLKLQRQLPKQDCWVLAYFKLGFSLVLSFDSHGCWSGPGGARPHTFVSIVFILFFFILFFLFAFVDLSGGLPSFLLNNVSKKRKRGPPVWLLSGRQFK